MRMMEPALVKRPGRVLCVSRTFTFDKDVTMTVTVIVTW
jgi:hypothetical protein